MAGGAAAGAAAAQAARRLLLLQEEEERMTPYGPNDLSQNWEFKIVRANTAVFGKPATFKRLLEEEARAGWTLVEKFDGTRVRFKRPQEARLKDATLPRGVDPYRVYWGISPGAYAAWLTITIAAVVGAFMAFIVLATR
jgi:hypothetical protein